MSQGIIIYGGLDPKELEHAYYFACSILLILVGLLYLWDTSRLNKFYALMTTYVLSSLFLTNVGFQKN